MGHAFSILNPWNGPHLAGETPEAGARSLPKVAHILPGERQNKPVLPVKTGVRLCRPSLTGMCSPPPWAEDGAGDI